MTTLQPDSRSLAAEHRTHRWGAVGAARYGGGRLTRRIAAGACMAALLAGCGSTAAMSKVTRAAVLREAAREASNNPAIRKYQELQHSLHAAFAGHIVPKS